MSAASPTARAARGWQRIGWEERLAFIQALCLVPAMHVAVRTVGFKRLHERLARETPPAADVRRPVDDRVRVAVVSVHRVKRYSIFRGNCLSQSLALAWMMRRRGIRPEIRLGARMTGQRLDAHAWVELNGRVLNDTQDVAQRFSPFVDGGRRRHTGH